MTKELNAKNTQGFSLVELSVVLIILGLLVGGVLGGRSLIKTAELRSVTEEFSQIESATLMFKEVYQQLPGDMTDATTYWNDTANGDGDLFVDYATSSNAFGETFTYWQHLALAEFLPGRYTGRALGGSYEDSLVDVNVMRARYPNGGWTISTIDGYDPSGQGWYRREYGHTLQIGSKIPDWEYGDVLFSPAEAFSIDRKFDDGNPATGKVVGRFWNNHCSTAVSGAVTSTNFNARYRTEDDNLRCALAFVPAFNYR